MSDHPVAKDGDDKCDTTTTTELGHDKVEEPGFVEATCLPYHLLKVPRCFR